MKKTLSDLYQDIILNESEKNSLQNPKNNEVGNLPSENMFGEVPDTLKGEGPEKAKLQKGPSYNKIDTGTSVASKETNKKFPKSAPAKPAVTEKGMEMEDEDVVPDHEEEEEEEEDKEETPNLSKKPHKESFTMSAFEKLFKQTLSEELNDEPIDMESSQENEDLDLDTESFEDEDVEDVEEEELEEEGDLISDLRDLQGKLNSILDRLESIESEEGEGDDGDGEEYSEDDFDDEFGDEDEDGDEDEEEEEMPVKESKQSNLKPVNKSKIKSLQHKNNKVGKISPKGGKAKGNNLKTNSNPKPLGDKKKALQHGSKAKSTVDKGDFFK